MFFRCITMYKQLQNSYPDISCVSIMCCKLISVTGPDSGRKMMDENCLHGNHVTRVTEERKCTERDWTRLCICDVVEEGESYWCREEGRDSERKTVCVCVSSSVCVSMSFYDDRTNDLLCHAWPWETSVGLGLHQPGGALWLSLELPVCLFPHRRLAKQQGPPPLPRVRSLSTPGKLWSDGQKKGVWEGFGNSKLCVCMCVCVCDGVADRKAGGWSGSGGVKGRCPSRLSRFLTTEEQLPHTCTNTHIQIYKDTYSLKLLQFRV